MALSTKDLRSTLAWVADAHGVDGPVPLTTELLDGLTELVGCEYATYEELDWAELRMTTYVWCSYEGPSAVPPPYVDETFWTADHALHKRPLWDGPGFVKHSDSLDRRERERERDETAFNAEFRVVDHLGFRVGLTRTRTAWLTFDSQRRDFDERDRELGLAITPQVEVLWRKAASRARLAELLAILGHDDDAGRAIVVCEPDGRIDYKTAAAQRLLRAWFGTRNGHLPEKLLDWVSVARPGDMYTERRNGSVLTVEAAGDSTLTLSECRSINGLTPREDEVLSLVAEGLTNAEIARRLWVAPSTVAKHLEQAYRKLGVGSRTAAVARLAQLAN